MLHLFSRACQANSQQRNTKAHPNRWPASCCLDAMPPKKALDYVTDPEYGSTHRPQNYKGEGPQ